MVPGAARPVKIVGRPGLHGGTLPLLRLRAEIICSVRKSRLPQPKGAELATSSSEGAQALAEAKFKKKELQLREGAKAKAEYEAGIVAERKKTARLKLLREAKEAADAKTEAEKKAVADTAKPRTKRRT